MVLTVPFEEILEDLVGGDEDTEHNTIGGTAFAGCNRQPRLKIPDYEVACNFDEVDLQRTASDHDNLDGTDFGNVGNIRDDDWQPLPRLCSNLKSLDAGSL